MASKPLSRPNWGLGHGTETSPQADALQFNKNKEVELRLRGRQWELVNGQLVEVEEDSTK